MLAILCNNSSLSLLFGEDKTLLGIITAACSRRLYIDLIRTFYKT